MATYWDILSAVTATMRGVTGNASLRKRLAAKEGEALPLCVVAPGRGGERAKRQAFNKIVVWVYPTLVGYVARGNGKLLLSQEFLDKREEIRDALYSFGAVDVASVYDFDLAADAPNPDWRWPDANYDACVFEAFFPSAETRDP